MAKLTSYHRKAYGSRANGSASKPDPERCAELVHSRDGWGRAHQCNRKRGHGPEGAYCKQHSPEAKAERDAKSQAKFDADWARFRRERAGLRALDIVEQIAAGHNDPRGLCEEFLKSARLGDRGER